MDLNHHAGLLPLVHDGLEHLDLLSRRSGYRSQGDLARKLDPHGGHFSYFGAGRFRGVIVQSQDARRDDARSVDEAGLDVIPERDVAVGRTAAGQDGRVAGLELSLHLRLLVGSGIDVAVRIDEPGHRRHPFGVDGPAAGGGRPARRHRHDLSRTDHDRSAFDDGAVGADDPGIGDREVLRGERRQRTERQTSDDRRVQVHQGVSFHLHSPNRVRREEHRGRSDGRVQNANGDGRTQRRSLSSTFRYVSPRLSGAVQSGYGVSLMSTMVKL